MRLWRGKWRIRSVYLRALPLIAVRFGMFSPLSGEGFSRQGDRLRKYPTYIERITGIPYDQFVAEHTGESMHADALLARFVELVMPR